MSEHNTTVLKEMDHVTALKIRNSLFYHLQRECKERGVLLSVHPVRLLSDAATTEIEGTKWFGFDMLHDELLAAHETEQKLQVIQTVVVDDINRNGPIARAVRDCV